MTALDASQAHVRMALASTIMGRHLGALLDTRFRSESFAIGNPGIQPEDITADAYQESPDITKFEVGGGTPELAVTWAPDDHYLILASHFGGSATPVEAPTGVWTHHLGAGETDVVFGDLNLEIWRHKDRGYLFTNFLPAQLTFEIGPRGYLIGSAQFSGNRFCLLGDAVIVTATGTPEVPAVRGFARSTLADDVFLEAQSISPLVVKCKVGSGSTYDGANIAITDGEWSPPLTDEADADLGGEGESVQIYVGDSSGWTVGDEIRIPYQRADWAATLPASSRGNEVLATILLDGVEAGLRSVTLTSTRPATVDEVIGGRFSDGRDESGFRSATWGITRRAIREVGLEDKLLHASEVQLRMTVLGPVIGATGVRRQLIFRSLNCRPTGETFAVGGPDNPEEAYELSAHPSTDGTYPHALNVEIVNGIADLTA